MNGWWAASYIILWCLVVTLAVIVVALARQLGTLHMRLGPRGALEIDDEGPPLGEAPEPIEADDVGGRSITIGGPGQSQYLLFVSPGCMVCKEVVPGLAAVAKSNSLAPVVVAGEDPGDDDLLLDPTVLGAIVVRSAAAMSAYNLPGTPYAVVTDRTGVVRAKGTVNNLEQMEGLADTARRRTPTEGGVAL